MGPLLVTMGGASSPHSQGVSAALVPAPGPGQQAPCVSPAGAGSQAPARTYTEGRKKMETSSQLQALPLAVRHNYFKGQVEYRNL